MLLSRTVGAKWYACRGTTCSHHHRFDSEATSGARNARFRRVVFDEARLAATTVVGSITKETCSGGTVDVRAAAAGVVVGYEFVGVGAGR